MHFGYTVKLSSNGSTMAIGSKGAHFNDETFGMVRVYDWDGSSWIQKGKDIKGDTVWYSTGERIGLSGDGKTLIIGAPNSSEHDEHAGRVRVFQWDTSGWVQKGKTFYGRSKDDFCGLSVDISADGNIITFSTADSSSVHGDFAGKVFTYKWSENSWLALGEPISGTRYWQFFGWHVSLNENGRMLAILSSKSDTVYTYEWVINQWRPTWNFLTGAPGNGYQHIDLSADGLRMSVGCPTSNRDSAGSVVVYKFAAQRWNPIGNRLVNPLGLNDFGHFTCISLDGETVATRASDDRYAYIFTYKFDGQNYLPFGRTLIDSFRSYGDHPIALNDHGQTISLGNAYDTSQGLYSGSVKVYSYCENSYSSLTEVANCQYTSPSGKQFLESSKFTDTLYSSTGCDSVITIDLTVLYPKLISKGPQNISATTHDNVFFNIISDADHFQWQLDKGTGYTDLADTGNYSGANRDSLIVSDLELSQNNFLFRCVVSDSVCTDTSESAWLKVQHNSGLNFPEWTKELQLFPNPSSKVVNIQCHVENTIVVRITLISFTGQIVLTSDKPNGIGTIDLSTIAPGYYSLHAELSNGYQFIRPLIRN